MAPSDELASAKNAFDEYLESAARPEHFVSVNNELGPLRRMDGDHINPTRRKFIGSRFKWNNAEIRWEAIDESPIVAETEIWDYLSKVISETDTRCHKKLSDRLMEKTEGLLRQDVRMMLTIWNDFGLDQTILGPEATVGNNEGEDASEQTLENSNVINLSTSSSGEPTSSTIKASSPHAHGTAPDAIVNTFHPKYSDFLGVGTSGIDGSMVWFAWRPLTGGKKPVAQFYNDQLDAKPKGELKIAWYAQFELEKFEGTPREKGISRRDYCRSLIRENETKPTTPKKRTAVKAKAKAIAAAKPKSSNTAQSHPNPTITQAQPKTRKRPHQDESLSLPPANENEEPPPPIAKRTRRASHAHTGVVPTPEATSNPAGAIVEVEGTSSDEPEVVTHNPVPQHPIIIKLEPLTYEQLFQTTLHVSASNQPGLAPATVGFGLCKTMEELFTIMIAEYDITSTNRIIKASATYTWNGKRHLLRRDRQEDWVLFCNAIKKAWSKEENQLNFLEDGCGIEMMVHAD